MDLRHLRSFVALAVELHFGRAARRMGIVQSALSAQIKALEDEIGAPLFVRTSRTVALSAIGAAFHADAVATLAQSDRALARAREAAAGRTGKVGIAFGGAAALMDLLPRHLAAFKADRPGVALELTEMSAPTQLTALADRAIDVGYCPDIGVAVPPGLRAQPIRSWPWHVAVSTRSDLAAREKVSAADLIGVPLIAYATEDGEPLVRARLRGVIGGEPVIAHRVENMMVALALAAADLGAAPVPSPVTSIALPGLTFRAVEGSAGRTNLLLVSRADETSPAVRAYLDVATGPERGAPPRTP